MGVAMDSLQAAVYTLLDAGLSTAVYDEVPDGSAYPYVTIGDFTEVARNAFGRTGRELTMTLHIWSGYNGWAEAQSIASQVDGLLDHATFAVDGWGLVFCQLDFAQTLPQADDGSYRHLAARYRLFVQEAP
jgi:hypothetical protein